MIYFLKVDELLHCYLDTMDCPIFRAAANKANLDGKPASLYVGVNGYNNNPITRLTGLTLALLLNQTVNRTKEECHNDDSDRVKFYCCLHCDLYKGLAYIPLKIQHVMVKVKNSFLCMPT
jgi:hypothetical protein